MKEYFYKPEYKYMYLGNISYNLAYNCFCNTCINK